MGYVFVGANLRINSHLTIKFSYICSVMTEEQQVNYTGDDIITLDWKEHIRRRPGMYIGKLGDGATSDDGIYVLLKEVLDNGIDEFMMGFGKQITVNVVEESSVEVIDEGRGIPLEKLEDVASKMNTGAKYDSKAFKKSVGLNGVGIKAVNALSTIFSITSTRDGKQRRIEFARGNIVSDSGIIDAPLDAKNGTNVRFTPTAIFSRTTSIAKSISCRY